MTEWRTIARFPRYEIDRLGNIRTRVRVKNKLAGSPVRVTQEMDRTYVARLWNDKRARVIGVARLLICAFKSPPPANGKRAYLKFVDGDRNNMDLENLVWSGVLTGETRICLRCREPFPKTHLYICPSCTEINKHIDEDYA